MSVIYNIVIIALFSCCQIYASSSNKRDSVTKFDRLVSLKKEYEYCLQFKMRIEFLVGLC